MEVADNRVYKDDLFRMLFKEARNFAQMYECLTNKVLDESELELCSTVSVFDKQLRNDVAFKTKDNKLIVMIEHQSTLNDNMPLRFLLYYVEFIKKHKKINDLDLFSKRRVDIPQPEFYVVYNGRQMLITERLTLFPTNPLNQSLDVNVKVKDIKYSNTKYMQSEKGDALQGYSYFVERTEYYKKKGHDSSTAFDLAVKDSIDNNFLTNYWNKEGFVVMAKEMYTIEDEMRDRKKEGIEEGKKEAIRKMAQKGMSKADIADIMEMTEKEIEDILSN